MIRLAALLALIATQAAAAGNCFPSLEELALRLATLGEVATGVGVSARGPAVVLFASPIGKATWTVVQVSPGGPACIIDYGEGWSGLRTVTGKPA